MVSKGKEPEATGSRETTMPRRLTNPVSRTTVQSLVDFVSKYAARGSEIAVRYRRGYRMETWTYAQIAQDANRVARELEFRGVAKGDAVLLWGEIGRAHV